MVSSTYVQKLITVALSFLEICALERTVSRVHFVLELKTPNSGVASHTFCTAFQSGVVVAAVIADRSIHTCPLSTISPHIRMDVGIPSLFLHFNLKKGLISRG